MLNNLYQSLDPVAFTIGPFSARWYGLAYVAGFICVIAIMYVVGKRWKMRFDFDSLCIIMLCAMIGVIVGGRLGYVLFYNWDMYAANPAGPSRVFARGDELSWRLYRCACGWYRGGAHGAHALSFPC